MFIFEGISLYLGIMTIAIFIGIAFVPFASQIYTGIVIFIGLIFYFILGSSSGWLGEIFFPILKISFTRANYILIELMYKLWDII